MNKRRYANTYGRLATKAVAIAESVLGRKLPSGAVVHHLDGNHTNDAHSNLAIFPSKAYHNLIHARMDALEATGNADSRKCQYCGDWGLPDVLWTLIEKCGRRAWHKKCRAKYELARYYVRKDGRQI